MAADRHRQDAPLAAYVAICPGCASHLEDTWTGEECGQCGFQYITVEAPGRQATDRRPASAKLQLLGTAVAVVGCMIIIMTMVSLFPVGEATASTEAGVVLIDGDVIAAMMPHVFATAAGTMLIFLGASLGGDSA